MCHISGLLFLSVLAVLSGATLAADGIAEFPDNQPVQVEIYLRGWGVLADDSRFDNLAAARRAAQIHVSARTVYANIRQWLQLKKMELVPRESRVNLKAPVMVIDVISENGTTSTYLADRNYLYSLDGSRRMPMGCDFKLSVTPKLWSSIFGDGELRRAWCD